MIFIRSKTFQQKQKLKFLKTLLITEYFIDNNL